MPLMFHVAAQVRDACLHTRYPGRYLKVHYYNTFFVNKLFKVGMMSKCNSATAASAEAIAGVAVRHVYQCNSCLCDGSSAPV
jgi:hypothetical protein